MCLELFMPSEMRRLSDRSLGLGRLIWSPMVRMSDGLLTRLQDFTHGTAVHAAEIDESSIISQAADCAGHRLAFF